MHWVVGAFMRVLRIAMQDMRATVCATLSPLNGMLMSYRPMTRSGMAVVYSFAAVGMKVMLISVLWPGCSTEGLLATCKRTSAAAHTLSEQYTCSLRQSRMVCESNPNWQHAC